jgi:hypothetical protein
MLLISSAAQAISLKQMVEYYVGPGDNTSLAPNQNLIESSLNKRRAQMSLQIKSQMDNGAIPTREGATLNFELQRLANEAERYQHSDGGYSRGETKLLVEDFARLSAQVDEAIERANKLVNYDDLDLKQAQLRNRLEAAHFSGQLTRAEADSVRFSLRWIDKLKAELIGDGAFTQTDYDKVSSAVERVNQRLSRWIQNREESTSNVRQNGNIDRVSKG